MKINIFFLLFIIFFAGCSSSMNSLKNDVKGIFIVEEDLKVAVKEAFITQEMDARSKYIDKVKLNQQLRVIALKDNDYWLKVLTPGIEGYIPKSAMIEKSVSDSVGKGLGEVWKFVNGKEKTSNEGYKTSDKGWSSKQKDRDIEKGFTKKVKTKEPLIKKVRYDEAYLDKFFTSVSKEMNNNRIDVFRKKGGLK